LTVAFAILVGVCTSETRQSSLPAALRQLLEANWLRAMGRYSYAIYIIHLPLSLLLEPRIARPPALPEAVWAVVWSAGITLLSFLLGALSYHLFEVHFLRLKRWFVPHPA
jgi:peptidoglycan/LPS O-acetylase OafA/YrhL